jgi:DNA (cytosine-5)-methyltransferase 1
MLCGGFPCQAFSIAGKRRGFNDTRGTLFFDIARILEVKRPKIVFLENVKGLLNHNKGETFKVIIQTLSELGYDVQWMVLNSKFFGVPQNRERVFIIGSLRGKGRPEILPFRESSEKNNATKQKVKIYDDYNQRWKREDVACALTQNCGSKTERNGQKILQINNPVHSNDRVYSEKGISPTINTAQGGNRQPFISNSSPREFGWKEYCPTMLSRDYKDSKVVACLTPDRSEKRQNGRRFKEEGEPSFTLTREIFAFRFVPSP